jgi:hypothetical protein
MIQSSSVLLLIFLSVFRAHATDNYSDFLLILPTQTLPQEFSFSVNAVDTGPVKFDSGTVKIEANPLVSMTEIFIPDLKISASTIGLKYSDIIQIVENGWTGSFQIEAQCEAMDINLSGEALLGWDPQTSQLYFIRWEVREDETDVKGKNCTGVNGFEKFLGQAFKNSEVVQKLLLTHQEAIRNWLTEKAMPYYNEWQPLGSVFWRLAKVQPGDGVISGAGHFFMRDEGEGRKDFVLNQPVSMEQPSIVLPQAFFKKWLRAWISDQTGGFNWTSNDVPSFKSLMRSRFLQFFIWPELMRFPKSTVFRFRINKFEVSDIQTLNRNQISIKAYIDGDIVPDGYGPYISVKWDLPLTVNLESQDNQLKIHLNNVGSSPEIRLAKGYNYKYSKGFPSSQIRKAIRQQLENKTWNFLLPQELLKDVSFDGVDIKDSNAYFLFRSK